MISAKSYNDFVATSQRCSQSVSTIWSKGHNDCSERYNDCFNRYNVLIESSQLFSRKDEPFRRKIITISSKRHIDFFETLKRLRRNFRNHFFETSQRFFPNVHNNFVEKNFGDTVESPHPCILQSLRSNQNAVVRYDDCFAKLRVQRTASAKSNYVITGGRQAGRQARPSLLRVLQHSPERSATRSEIF